MLTDISGATTDSYQYGPYGELLNHTGNSNTQFLYNGRDGVMTDGNGLYYMRARYYSPEMQRFVSRDSLEGSITDLQSLNRYAFVNGKPISFIDPLGLELMNWANLGNTFKETGEYLCSDEAQEAYINTAGAILEAHVYTLTKAEAVAIAAADASLMTRRLCNTTSKTWFQKATKPSDYLNEALKRQGLKKAPNNLKEKWFEYGYDFEIRVHPANLNYGKKGSIYRVARRKQGVNENGQGYGWEYMDKSGKWYHTSALKTNDKAAEATHIQLP